MANLNTYTSTKELIVLRILLLLLLFNFVYGATSVTIYTHNDYRPYSYVENGKVKGIHVEILQAIFKKMRDYSLEIVPIAWEEGLEKMQSEEILILTNLYHRPKEHPYILDYSAPYIYDAPSIYCNRAIALDKPNNIDWQVVFKGLKIAKQKDMSLPSSDSFNAALQTKTIELIENSHEKNMLDLINKKIDCYINDSIALQSSLILAKHQYKEDNKTLQNINDITKITQLSRESIHLGFSKKYFAKRKDLISKINLAILVMQNSNEIDKIVKHYLEEFVSQLEVKTIRASIYPLGSFISNDMDTYGLLAEIVTTAFADRNITVEYYFRDRNQAYLYNKWGRDCMSFPWTKESDTWLYSDLSEPIMVSDINFFYEKNHLPNGILYNDLYDLKDYRICGLKGAFYERFFSGMSFNYRSFDNEKALLTALTLKQIDVVPMNKHLFFDALKRYMPHKLEEFAYHETPMVKKANYILFSKKCKDALLYKQEFNQGFANIQQDGRFDKILEKYTTTDKEKEEFEKIFRNMKKVEKAEESSVFDSNTTDINASDLNITDSNLTIEKPHESGTIDSNTTDTNTTDFNSTELNATHSKTLHLIKSK
ncbi:MAG: transporter substrate-binding domain-containing protein [Campylobacterales bacterium]|nr:transporter substrate-binding domain-containing protein [Campylobacterales bacterium]